jgi:proteic killer suppression protein
MILDYRDARTRRFALGERLTGDRRGQYSIRINDQWRICFVWNPRDMGPSQVEIVDYH